VSKVVCGYWHSVVIEQGGRVWSAGDGSHGELGRQYMEGDQFKEVESSVGFKDASCGYGFTFLISTDNELYSCGKKTMSGHKQNTLIPTLVPKFKGIGIH
jgi:alpha-tubulin suppressor-like RCC1 family protein